MIACAVKHRVLIIDDDLGPRESLRILLKNEFEVFTAENVARGVELLREKQPDAVVMDIRMPGKNGIEGLREIRALDPHVSVIMLTGFGALETAQEALRLGASDYLKKPFDTLEMLEIIRSSVRRTALNRKRAGTERELQEINSRLTKELAKKDRLASMGLASTELVHDLRNPLAVVLGYVQLLSEDLRRARETQQGTLEATAEYVSLIERNVQRCREIVDTWQDLGRSSGRRQEAIRIETVLREVVEAHRPLAAGRRASLELILRDEQTRVLGDAVQLGRAFQNLIQNAIDAVPREGGRICVMGELKDGKYRVSVIDNGHGIQLQHLENIFSAYFTTKPDNRGTGLGLFITHRIVKDHEGTIEVKSEPDRGTEMIVTLPVWSEIAPAS
jgi:signal transduction histidine kinase